MARRLNDDRESRHSILEVQNAQAERSPFPRDRPQSFAVQLYPPEDKRMSVPANLRLQTDQPPYNEQPAARLPYYNPSRAFSFECLATREDLNRNSPSPSTASPTPFPCPTTNLSDRRSTPISRASTPRPIPELPGLKPFFPPEGWTPHPEPLPEPLGILPDTFVFNAAQPRILKATAPSRRQRLKLLLQNAADHKIQALLSALREAGSLLPPALTTAHLTILLRWPVVKAAFAAFRRDLASIEEVCRARAGKEPEPEPEPANSLPYHHHDKRAQKGDWMPYPLVVESRLLPGLHQDWETLDMADHCPVDLAVLAGWNAQIPWLAHSESDGEECSVDSYYARFILQVLAHAHHCDGTDGAVLPFDSGNKEEEDKPHAWWWQEVQWFRDPDVVGGIKGQIWVLYMALFFLHCEMRQANTKRKRWSSLLARLRGESASA